MHGNRFLYSTKGAMHIIEFCQGEATSDHAHLQNEETPLHCCLSTIVSKVLLTNLGANLLQVSWPKVASERLLFEPASIPRTSAPLDVQRSLIKMLLSMPVRNSWPPADRAPPGL